MNPDIVQLDPNNLRDLRPQVLDPQGRLKVMPADFYAQTSRLERALLGTRIGAYGFPTTELVDWLRSVTRGKRAIEIGSGNGVLASAAGLIGTDSFLQREPSVRRYMEALQQPLIPYDDQLDCLPAEEAIRRHKPDIVVGCWVTHRYDAARPEAGGNSFGIDESWVVENCKTYIFIGNEEVHKHKAIWTYPHKKYHPNWVYSKAHNGSADFIAIWGEQPSFAPI